MVRAAFGRKDKADKQSDSADSGDLITNMVRTSWDLSSSGSLVAGRAHTQQQGLRGWRQVGRLFPSMVKDMQPAGLQRMTVEQWPDQWPAVTDQYAAPVEGDDETMEVLLLAATLRLRGRGRSRSWGRPRGQGRATRAHQSQQAQPPQNQQ